MFEKEVQEFIEKHVKKIKPLIKKTRIAYWNATTTGEQKFYREYEALQKEIEKIYNNKEEFELVKKFLSSGINEKLIKRQIEILYYSYLGSQGDLKLIEEIIKKSTEIEQKFNTFRAKIKNKEFTDNEIIEILKTETNSPKLQEAWGASKEQGALVGKDLIELIKLRNKLAQNLGFKNYYCFSLEINEQNEQEITKIFEQLDKLTEKPFKQLKQEIDLALSKKYNIQENELKPWHHQDLFFQESPKIYNFNLDTYYKEDILKIASQFFNNLDLPVQDILERSDLYERPGKYQHAYCMDIDREGDIRAVMNIKNNEKWMETVLHELGHAVYWKFINKNLPYLLRDAAHIFITEAVAQLFGRQSKNTSFIKNYCNIQEKELENLTQEIEKMLRMRQLIFSRWSQVMVNFEKSLYENPDQNLNKLWWDLVQKYQLINFSRDRPDWASKIHLVSSPVYYHNYPLGELFASQIHDHIVKDILKQDHIKNVEYSGKKEIGKYLKTFIFNLGKRYKWQELIKKATNKSLETKYYVQEFCQR